MVYEQEALNEILDALFDGPLRPYREHRGMVESKIREHWDQQLVGGFLSQLHDITNRWAAHNQR